jgi:hypothetical protein
MRRAFFFLLCSFVIFCTTVFGQRPGKKEYSTMREIDDSLQATIIKTTERIQQQSNKQQLENSLQPDTTIIKKPKQIIQEVKEDIHQETKQIKSSVEEQATNLKPDTTDIRELKNQSKDLLEKKASNLQYDSENPDEAPWKKKQFSKDDLKEIRIPTHKPELPTIDNKAAEYKEKVSDLQNAIPDENKLQDQVSGIRQSSKLERAKTIADSLITIKDRIEATSIHDELLNAKTIYSQKIIEQLYDSLGGKKADSLLKIGTALALSEDPKQELLNKINNPLEEHQGLEGLGFDQKNQTLTSNGADQLMGLPGSFAKADLASLQLPPELLAELAPLKGQLMDSKYVKAVDSVRDVVLKAKGYLMNEKQLTEELTKTVFEKKPSFLDKSYFEIILGFVNDTTFTVVQVSPSFGYHFTKNISVGVGPNIAIQYQEKKVSALAGFRSFAKAEFFRQRTYLQLEDNVSETMVNKDAISGSKHSVLAGAGALLPITKKLAINLSILYRVNQDAVNPKGSPWVFRIGLSSVKNIGNE